MRILNLYAGIGGNRKLWGDEHEITAVEREPKIAAIYQDFFPKDKTVVADAHQYLLDHFKEFDFIWSSPPCPTHSRARFWGYGKKNPVYPDMILYQEIILLKHHAENKWVVENVNAYYEPLYPPQKLGRHYYWSNFAIGQPNFKPKAKMIKEATNTERQEMTGFNLDKYNGINKMVILRNCVEPELGLHILKESQRDIQGELFR